MTTGLKRLTFVVTPDVEELLKVVKQEFFYSDTWSDMIRKLVSVGVEAIREENDTKE